MVDLDTAGYEEQLKEARDAARDFKDSNIRGVRNLRGKPDLVSQLWDETFAEMSNKGRIFVDDAAQVFTNNIYKPSTEKKKPASPMTSTLKPPAAPTNNTSPHVHVRLSEDQLYGGADRSPQLPHGSLSPQLDNWVTTKVEQHCRTTTTTERSTRHQSPARMPLTARDRPVGASHSALPRAAVWCDQSVPGITGRSGSDRRRRAKAEGKARKMSERTERRLREKRERQLPWDNFCSGDINISYPHLESSDEEGDRVEESGYYGHCHDC